jgi:1,4-dihydroxy-2-naphthoyl-CoA synthase
MGLAERVVAATQLDDAVEEWVEDLLAAGAAAIRAQKALLRVWEGAPLAQAIEAGIECLAQAYEGDEPQRLINRFLQRRRVKVP